MLAGNRSQSALEYMMTYGWAILIIVIVAVILYSMGIFNPSSSISATITGFASAPVSSAICTSNGVLRFAVGDTTSNIIKIKNITATIGSKTVTFTPNATIDPNPTIAPGNTYTFSVPNVCPSAGTHFSAAVTINYTEPGSIFPSAVYPSSGTITGTVSSTTLPAFVADFNGAFTTYGTANPQLSGINVNWIANQNYSISVWINFNAVSGGQANQCFVYITNGGTMCPLAMMSSKFLGSVWQVNDVTSTNNASVGKWYNIILSYNDATGTNVLYVNGIYIGATTGKISFPSQGSSEVLTLGYPISGPPCIFSSSCTPSIGMSTISGYVSDFQFYDSALTSAEASGIYKEGLLGKPLSNALLFLWLPLNGTIRDYSANKNALTTNNVFSTSDYASS
ncbi:MAG: hypothetical protein BJBARM5_0386 [Candidatus Parvarchaeum acidophilus ARMAN-5]|uniref:LamG domain protein jellyroll fold domain protein n=1 Tax=Candidatus Parvarchaeum acidophilus ARMAN-5 TaxID=662762 RepID=D6GV79_PARA5|nr:MAG: hypothetical protein BJBARM5_0386 [Candidatus Parvarchaeum acidophilus ARMAN-5]